MTAQYCTRQYNQSIVLYTAVQYHRHGPTLDLSRLPKVQIAQLCGYLRVDLGLDTGWNDL